ncbi:hypothetical protein DFJ58DRAFT_717758 [Suillus subalutaceus]|uniref:uncharacterized protein n=1 Tax=Suillus subalutaceus TaxID=48586 RepID=UPI001B863037|nr:uncharacterized protein DFJ58DRAFT_717758 [Suillus subalutaceus]KAG1843581.1 hypothetical protein DFJ58DRAFT_717758 [Suillus subalutaceus]
MSHSSCPSCGKAFKDHTSIAHHMSQPRSGWNTWLEDVINFITPSEDHNMDSADDENIDVSYDPGLGGEEIFHYFGEDDITEGTGGHEVHGEVIDYFPEPPLAYEDGYTFLGLFDADENNWQVTAWLLRSGLSMGNIDSFLSLEMIKDLPLSFCSARELRGRAEMLPSGPCWKSQVIPTSHPTKSPVILYWRDPIECITSIFNHPLFHHHMDLTPCKVYSTAKRLCRSGTHHVFLQSAIPKNTTLLGTILSSDKTNLTALTGDHVAHPLLISLANIHMNVHLKSSTNSFILAALLPVPRFIHKKKQMKGILEDHLIHQCLKIVLEPLKQATQHGIMLSDPIGHTSTTLAQLAVVRLCTDPNDLEVFFREAQKFQLNGVDKLFWWDYILADPSRFLTLESLHHLHKEFFDHDAQWLINAPITGYQHFYDGISKLKQVTGCCEWEIQHYIIAVSADAAPVGVITAVRALMEFRYLIQSPHVDEDDLECISGALTEFHANKDAIIAAGLIPKLELMQSIISSIWNSGVIGQWSADITEHAHIMEIKDPARLTNYNNYNTQIYRHLDCAEKCHHFELATSLLDHGQRVEEERLDLDAEDSDVDADALQQRKVGSVPVPLCSFVKKCTAFHLGYEPSIRSITVDEVTIRFSLPDLRLAIADFLQCEATYGRQHVHAIGGPRRAGPTAVLPFNRVQVWFKIQLQEMDFHETHIIKPAQTLNCAPPNNPWILGHYDTVIIEISVGYSWPSSRLSAKRSNGNWMGDIILVSQLRAPVQLIPRFGATADKRLTTYNSLEHAAEFWLNEFWDRSTFFALSV